MTDECTEAKIAWLELKTVFWAIVLIMVVVVASWTAAYIEEYFGYVSSDHWYESMMLGALAYLVVEQRLRLAKLEGGKGKKR